MNWLRFTESSFDDALNSWEWFSTMTGEAVAGKLAVSPDRREST